MTDDLQGQEPAGKALLDLAARCEAARGPDCVLDLDIHAACEVGQPFAGDQVTWMLMHGQFRDYTRSLDAARSLTDWVLLHMSEIGADGLPYVVLGNPATSPTQEAKGIGGRTLALTYCAAALRARATGETA